jgi:hypothetical protein
MRIGVSIGPRNHCRHVQYAAAIQYTCVLMHGSWSVYFKLYLQPMLLPCSTDYAQICQPARRVTVWIRDFFDQMDVHVTNLEISRSLSKLG